jgi:hypothetical protein
MSQLIKKPVALFGLVGLLFVVPFVLRMTTKAALPLVSLAPTSWIVTPASLEVALISAGLDADALAAAGVSPVGISGLVDAAESTLAQQPLEGLNAALGTARTACDERERKVQSGLATPQEVSGFATLKAALTAAENNRRSALDALFTAAAATLQSEPRTVLTTIRANRAWGLPIEFLTVNRSEADWIALRDALSNERICTKNGETPNVACQAMLTSARANVTVAAAKAAHGTNLAAVTTAWNTAVHD